MKMQGIIWSFIALASNMAIHAAAPLRFDTPDQYVAGAYVLDQAHFEVATQAPYLLTISPPYLVDQVRKGGLYYYQLIYRSTQEGKKLPTGLDGIVALVWYLYAQAIGKDQPFDSGIMVIDDPGFVLYNYLYAFVNRAYKGNMQKELHVALGGSGAYPRASTHFNEYYAFTGKVGKNGAKLPAYTHYGIDLPKSSLLHLPAGKKHILFGKVDDGRMFIKLEASGLGPKGIARHSIDLVKSKIRKKLPPLLKRLQGTAQAKLPEQSVLSGWLDGVANLVTPDNAPSTRRENVPLDVLLRFGTIMLSPDAQATKLDAKKINAQVKALGISAMLRFLDQWARNAKATKQWREDAMTFAQEIRTNYDYTERRIGREVILSKPELWSCLFYYVDSAGGPPATAKALYNLGGRLRDIQRAKFRGQKSELRDLIQGRTLQPVMKSLSELYQDYAELKPTENKEINAYLEATVIKEAGLRRRY